MFWRLFSLVLLAGAVWGQAEPAGMAYDAAGRRLITWSGRGLRAFAWPGLGERRLRPEPFGEAGCLAHDGFAGVSGGRLLWVPNFTATPRVIDTGVETHDCLITTLDGRRGVLVMQRHAQLRFHQMPATPDGPWIYREIYSIYTPSRQGGLLAAPDIDGDQRPDLFAGNYWLRNPGSPGLPWRLFAMNLYFEEPDSALARLAWSAPYLYWAESHRPDARVTRFEPVSDPRKLWMGERLTRGFPVHYPHGLAVAGNRVWVGENNGTASRLILFGSGAPRVVRQGQPVHALVLVEGVLVAVGPNGVPVRIDPVRIDYRQ
ncbi:MAG: hypothetical protein FJW40_00625 [Acidobacteria bacterium]|nr:hypothetical protein [Acidobacteriota bacterium]